MILNYIKIICFIASIYCQSTLSPNYIFTKTAKITQTHSGNSDKITDVSNLFVCHEFKCEKITEFKLQTTNNVAL